MGNGEDAITPETVKRRARRTADTLAAAFADHEPQITIDDLDEVRMEIPCPSASVDNGL